ncbi:MAG: tRNA (adenosine(37)-N6)-threonylcarbamoyltransferase complex transferase subunit TsaD [Saprospiraceae bacterium]|nr:tRNA (adenosine(37)-N6)-threonylcarbamoyltransferase complex transferase subunit TsaD [Saprospiraceae bacterium]
MYFFNRSVYQSKTWKKNISILAIESSCDDTSAAVIVNGTVLSNRTANQTVHEQYGGVIPELASRQHLSNIIPVIEVALKDANMNIRDVYATAFTPGPGLLGSLIVGVSMAKALALSLDIPLIEVHHMHAHVLAHFAEAPRPEFPFICLTVSGGHTQIVLVKSYYDMEILGSTIDDAAGEAFDKTGKMLGLDYPAGPIIDKLAQKGVPKFKFPEPQVGPLDFSFSGLKTSILYFLQKEMAKNPHFINENLNDICSSVQNTIIHILIGKLIKASEMTGIKNIGIAGGVSANSQLRQTLTEVGKKHNWHTFIPSFAYCTDNAGMIGVAGYYKYLRGEFTDQNVSPLARMDF